MVADPETTKDPKKKIVVTGSSGMLGCALSKVLSNDYQVFGIDLEDRFNLANFRRCDVTEFNRVKQVVFDISPDIIIHSAAYTDVDGCQRDEFKARSVNTQGSINIARLSRAIESRLFFISTDYVFNGCKKTPYNEEDSPSPLNVYGKSKLDAERFIQVNLRKYFIIRTSWLYGRYGKNFVDVIISAAKAKPLLEVVEDQIGGPTYVLDLAEAIKVLIKRTDGFPEKYSGIYNITNSGRCSWYQFAKEIIKISKLKVKIIPMKSSRLSRPAKRPKNSLLNNLKFNRLTKKPMRHWKKTLEAYLENNYSERSK